MQYRLLAALCSLGVAGCYSPSVAPCVYACANDQCPSGLACNPIINMCVASASDTCNGQDGGVDSQPNGDATSCGWPALSNIDPCTADYAIGYNDQWNAAGSVNTDDLTTFMSQGLHPVLAILDDMTLGVVVPVDHFSISFQTSLLVKGTRPLIIVASSGVAIDGPINLIGMAMNVCGNTSLSGGGSSGTSGAGGGGGGGHASVGGKGGGGNADNSLAVTVPGGPAGAIRGDASGVPLTVGCPGGNGGGEGGATMHVGAENGFGGGAIQISTRGTFKISSGIVANGTGGKKSTGGRAAPGGGGSGGSILLEAPMIMFSGTSVKLCANGGGGGGFMGNGESSMSCDPARGGLGIDEAHPGNASGGDGGYGEPPTQAGQSGNTPADPANPSHGGGGGGGAAGRIHVNTHLATGTATFSPAPVAGSFLDQ